MWDAKCRRSFVCLLCAALLAGCAALLSRPQAPRLSLAGVRVVEVGLFEQRYRLRLRVQNPNAFELPIGGLDYELRVNGYTFASGVNNAGVTVPAYGTEILEVDAYSNLSDFLRRFLEATAEGSPRLQYRLKGRVRLRDRSLTLPFDYRGEVLPEGSAPPKGT